MTESERRFMENGHFAFIDDMKNNQVIVARQWANFEVDSVRMNVDEYLKFRTFADQYFGVGK